MLIYESKGILKSFFGNLNQKKAVKIILTTQSENDTVTFQQDIAKETLSNGIYSFGYFPGVTVYTVYIQPLKMELTQGSETSANYNLTPGKYPKEYIQYSNHGESLKSSSTQ